MADCNPFRLILYCASAVRKVCQVCGGAVPNYFAFGLRTDAHVDLRKKFRVPMRNRTSDLRTPRIDALPMSHKDSTVIEVYYELIWRRNITEIQLRSKRFCHIPRRSRSHLPNNHAQQLQAYSDHSASWWTDITTKRTRCTASWFQMSIEISF